MAFQRILAAGVMALTACAGGEAASTDPAPETATSNQPAIIEAEVADTPPTQPAPEPVVPPTISVTEGKLTQGGFIRGSLPANTARATLGDEAVEFTDTGSFFAAFDRDSGGTLTLKATLNSGEVVAKELTVTPREWKIQRVNVAKGTGRSSEAWWQKRKPEWEAINAARAKQTAADGWKQDFIWPVKGRISGLFGRQRIYRGEPGSYHSGIDIAPGNGVPFVAPADGVVVLARTGFSLEGNLIIIDHGAGLNSAFLHASKIAVKEGEAVKQGQYIGNVGSTGRSTGPHLHWGLKWNSARLDPLLFTGPMD